MRLLLISMLCLVLSTVPAQAQEQPNVLTLPDGQALLHISADERMEVGQDLLVANLRFEVEDTQSSAVQDKINKAMKKALDQVERVKDVKAQTLQYNIHKTTIPRTKEQVWRGSQGLQLKSTKADELLELSGDLQNEGFLISGLSYTLSPDRAADLQDSMMEAALQKLQSRADRAAKALGKSGATLVEVNVSGGHVPAPVSMYRGVHMEMAAMKTADTAPPVASAGETTLNLTVSAKAILKP